MDATGTPVTPPPAPAGTLSADGKLMLFGYKLPPPQPLAPPRIVDLKPMVMTLEPGRYSWCSCGYSRKQPFCDDSHRAEEFATNRKSFKFEVLERAEIAFCMCRQTGSPPYCDNTCKVLTAAAAAVPACIHDQPSATPPAPSAPPAFDTLAAAGAAVPVAAPAVIVPAPASYAAAYPAQPAVLQPSAAYRAISGTLGPAAGALLLLARLCFSYMFLMAGWGHYTGIDRTLGSVGENMPFIPAELQPVFAWGAAVLLLGGGLLILLGLGARLGAALIVAFLIPTLLFWHDYWNFPEEEVRMQTIQFQKNLAMLGGALYILTLGAGPASLDALFRRRR